MNILPVPRSKQENEFIAKLLPNKHIWLGVNDIYGEGIFTDPYGKPATYFNWGDYEPNNFENKEHAVYIDGSSHNWNDFDQSKFKGNQIYVICVYFPTGI